MTVRLSKGSIPERDSDGKLYNTATVYSPEGNRQLLVVSGVDF